MSSDVIILQTALNSAYESLEMLLKDCLDADNKPKVPSSREVMKARAMLPPRFDLALTRSKDKHFGH